MLSDDFDPNTLLAYIKVGALTATVDAQFAPALLAFNTWCVKPGRNTLYARCYHRIGTKRVPFFMHRCIMVLAEIKPPSSRHLIVDHRNGNGLDNRLENLRWVTHSQNAKNIRGFDALQGDLRHVVEF